MCALWFFPHKIVDLFNFYESSKKFSHFNNKNLATSSVTSSNINIATAFLNFSNLMGETTTKTPSIESLLLAEQQHQQQQSIEPDLLIKIFKNQTISTSNDLHNNYRTSSDKLAYDQFLLSLSSLLVDCKSSSILPNKNYNKIFLKSNINKNLKNTIVQQKLLKTKQKKQGNKFNDNTIESNHCNNKKITFQNKIYNEPLSIKKKQIENDFSTKLSSTISTTAPISLLENSNLVNLTEPLSSSENAKKFSVDHFLPCSYTPKISISESSSKIKNKNDKQKTLLSTPISFSSNAQSPIFNDSSSTNSSIVSKNSIATSTLLAENIKNAVAAAAAAAAFVQMPVNFFYFL